VLVVVAVVAAGWLGLWQYHGWQDRREAEARDLTQVAPIPLGEAIGPDDPFLAKYVGQPVEVRGTWVPDATVYISGREHDGHDGYWVVDPIQVGDSLLPAVRGWSATPRDVPPPSGEANLVGWLQPSEAATETDEDPGDDVLPQLRVADLAQRFDQDLYGAYVVVREPLDEGLVQADLKELPDASRFTAVRNLFYAVEWWFFGAFAVLVWWRWARETVALEGAGEATPGERSEDPGVPAGDTR
jgi:surfeit locus 1 family protein